MDNLIEVEIIYHIFLKINMPFLQILDIRVLSQEFKQELGGEVIIWIMQIRKSMKDMI